MGIASRSQVIKNKHNNVELHFASEKKKSEERREKLYRESFSQKSFHSTVSYTTIIRLRCAKTQINVFIGLGFIIDGNI